MFINVRNFHWIMLIIMVDERKVELIDPLYKNKELYQDIIDLLQR